MARESQYVEGYLYQNWLRGWGYGLTPGSYLTYVLRGRAKQYTRGYLRALVRACEDRVARSEAVVGLSRMGGVAYYPAGTEQEEVRP